MWIFKVGHIWKITPSQLLLYLPISYLRTDGFAPSRANLLWIPQNTEETNTTTGTISVFPVMTFLAFWHRVLFQSSQLVAKDGSSQWSVLRTATTSLCTDTFNLNDKKKVMDRSYQYGNMAWRWKKNTYFNMNVSTLKVHTAQFSPWEICRARAV